ncbi:MAG: SAM-dependent methyltransferase [Pyrinomonadaceae bacterium]
MSTEGARRHFEAVLDDLLRAAGGSLSVEEYMRAALYHPEVGYYSRHVRGIGRRGDFSTSVTLSPALGQAIARWAVKRRRTLGLRWKWHLIEVGAGTGQLALAVLNAFSPLARRRVVYHIVEASQALIEIQQSALGAHHIRWHADVQQALAAADGAALVFSNELADAFPCVQIERTDRGWEEVRVTRDERGFAEILVPFADERAAHWPPSVLAKWREFSRGQRCEVHFAYAAWLGELAGALKRGRLLTIDYGDDLERLYYRRPRGTLRGYIFHTLVQGLQIYQRFGRQDLTADINFTDLATWGAQCGLLAVDFIPQRDFLLRYLPRAEAQAAHDPALAFLLNPDGVGGLYKVIEQAPGISSSRFIS